MAIPAYGLVKTGRMGKVMEHLAHTSLKERLDLLAESGAFIVCTIWKKH